MIRISFFILVFTTSVMSNAQNDSQVKILDSIQTLRSLSIDEQYLLTDRLKYAQLASELSENLKIDSTLLLSNKNLATHYLNAENYDLYRKTNTSNLDLATRLKDSSSMAIAYQNLAWYYYVEKITDSSYYYYSKALDIYNALGRKQNEGEVLLNMADLQETERDYIGSETNAIKAIKLIQQLPKNDNNLDTLWILHNLIGITSRELKLYDKALEYHEIALDYSKEMSNGDINRLFSLNNIALVYRAMEDYETALEYHKMLLDVKNLIQSSPESYVSYLTNYTYTKFLSGNYNEEETLQNFWRSFKMSDSLDYDFGSMTVSDNLSDYYFTKGATDSALYYRKISYDLAKSSHSNEDLLKSMLSLSQIQPGDEAKKHLNDYIKLSDSLLRNERAARNKFARVIFETDQIKAENVQISRQRLILLLVSIGLLITLFLLYIIISQRIRNKQLEFNQKQQQANEEIYNLMLVQQDKMDEGRTQEKKRISEELHDGILGRLFGTRLSLDSLNFQQTDEAIKTRSQYIDELKLIEQEIRKISHDLNTDFVSGSSFSDILATLIENQTKAFQLTYDYHEDEDIDWDGLSNKTKIHIYRMLQETMQNIYKHANANHIKISFELKNSVILLTVNDDGSGFNTNKARKGIGLKNFDSRANMIGGKVEIFSKLGKGTTVKIHVPVD